MPTRKPAVLFDLDGTLLDTIDLLLSSMRHAFRDSPERMPKVEDWVAGIGTPLTTQLRPYASDDADVAALAASYRVYQREHHDRLTRAYEGAVDTVAAIHATGRPTAVVTSKANDIAMRSVQWCGLDRFIDVIVGADSTTRHKPDPEPVRYALAALAAPAETAVFVGDSPHDIHAGNAAGVISVGALWGPFSRDQVLAAGPRYTLDRIRDLPALLDRLGAATTD
jgi:pyrophosphatase PpaX